MHDNISVKSASLPEDEGEQFRLLIESVRDYAIFLTDTQGRIVTWNPGVQSILGYEEAEFLGQNAAIIFTPEDRERGEPQGEMEEAARRGRAEDERWHLKKDGSRFFASGVVTALRDKDGALCGYSKILRDTTEGRRQREEEKRRSREMRYLMTRARALLWHGTVRDGGDGDYVWDLGVFDEEAAQTFFPLDLGPDERYTDAWYRNRLPEGKALTDQLSRQAFRENRGGYSAEFGCRSREGAVCWFSEEVHVEPLAPGQWRVVGVALDISERKHQEEALKALHRQISEVLESISDAFYAVDAEWRFTYVNRNTERLWGMQREQVLGKHLWEVFPRSAGSALQEAMLRAMDERQAIQMEYWSPVLSAWLEVNLYPTGAGLSVYFRDITERKTREAEREAQSEKNRRIAETLQRAMLTPPPRGAFPGLEVETLYKSALNEAAVGGDFFDAFWAGGSRVALVVGDVSGKGLAAAQRTSQVKYALRAFVQEYLFPARALGRLNRLLYDSLSKEDRFDFVTVSLAVVDTATGLATFALAGSESPLVLRSGGNAPRLIQAGGLPLGIDPEADYTAEALELAHGDMLLLFTDGLTEAHTPRGPLLEREGLLRLAEEAQQNDLREMGETIVGAARTFSGGSFRDDVCLLLARWTSL